DTTIDHASTAVVVPVQEIPKANPKPQPKSEAVAAPAEEAVEEVTEVAEAVEEVVEEGVEEAASGAVETFVIEDNDDSFIEWVGYKSLLGTRLSMKGGFMEFEGTITVVDDAPDESSVELTIDLTELYSENVILTRVLKAEFFFAVDKYPTAHFISSKVEPVEGNEYTVTGNLTMRDKTVGIQFPAVIERRGDQAFASAEFTIDRSHWGVGFDEWEEFVILNEVVLSFEVLANPA
ncbi:MAG: YceI family protein, partial [Candidatus Hydrogenedens sp.]|nr:YceI family protein [Candidatus Hydrogenedens sp.]